MKLLTSGSTARKIFKIAKLSILLFSTLVLFVGTPHYGRGIRLSDFPAAHADFLGSASYEALLDDNGDAFSASPTPGPIVVGPNVRVNGPQQPFPNGLLGRSETAIAVGEDGNSMVAGFNDAQGFCGPPFNVACTPPNNPGLSGFSFSTDGGNTWTDGGTPPNFNGIITRGDPWMAVSDESGSDTFLYANLAIDSTGASLGMSVHRGNFTGTSFAWNDARALAPPSPNDFYDKEAMAARSGIVILSVTNFIGIPGPATCTPAGGFGQIEVWRSQDGGNTFQGPVVAGPDMTNLTDPNCLTGVLQQGSDPAIGKDSKVVVAWTRGPSFAGGAIVSPVSEDIVAASSSDKGASFSSPVVVHTIVPGRQNPPVGYNRARYNDFPRIAISRSTGRVFAVFQDAVVAGNAGIGGSGTICLGPFPSSAPPSLGPPCPNATDRRIMLGGGADTDIYLSFSDNNGMTWSTPTLINPTAGDGKIQFWPVVSVGARGEVNVVYYESREISTSPIPATPTTADIECSVRVISASGSNPGRFRRSLRSSLVDTFFTQSLDGGTTFRPPVKVSSVTSNWCKAASNIRPNFGDYIASVSVGLTTFAVWADDRNTVLVNNVPRNVPDTFFASIQDPPVGGGRGFNT